MRTPIAAAALALALSASAAAAAPAGPIVLGDAELDSVTAGQLDLGGLLGGGPLLNLNVNAPIDIRDVTVDIRDVNVNAVVNAAVVAPILSPGTNNVRIRQEGRIRYRRR